MSSIQKLPGGSYLHAGLTSLGNMASKFVSAMKVVLPGLSIPVHPPGIIITSIHLIASAIASAATYYVFGPKALEAPAKDVANISLDKLNASLPEGVAKIENFDVDSLRAAKDSVVAVKQKKANVSQNVGARLSTGRSSRSRLSGVNPVRPNPPKASMVLLAALKNQIAALYNSAQARLNNVTTSAKKHSAPEVTNTNVSKPNNQPNPNKPI